MTCESTPCCWRSRRRDPYPSNPSGRCSAVRVRSAPVTGPGRTSPAARALTQCCLDLASPSDQELDLRITILHPESGVTSDPGIALESNGVEALTADRRVITVINPSQMPTIGRPTEPPTLSHRDPITSTISCVLMACADGERQPRAPCCTVFTLFAQPLGHGATLRMRRPSSARSARLAQRTA